MQEKTTTATAPQAPKTTEEILASLETLSDAKVVIREQADRIGQLEARVAWLVRQWIGQKCSTTWECM